MIPARKLNLTSQADDSHHNCFVFKSRMKNVSDSDVGSGSAI